MSKLDKVKEKLLNAGATISFQEIEYLFDKLGYEEKRTGKTSGSRKVYVNSKSKHIIRLHKPHPENELKKYVKLFIINELKKNGLL